MTLPYYDAETVERLLDYLGCTAAMREAMTALSTGGRAQPLRQIVPLRDGAVFGVMPGDLTAMQSFGAKLISVFRDPENPGHSRHIGVVTAFDLASGALTCLADAEAVTTIRTACATAAATDALARTDASVLAVFGTGTQALSHICALAPIRPWETILVWGRSIAQATKLAAQASNRFGRAVTAIADAQEAARRADVICTVTCSREPVLFGAWVRPGTHVNLVGSSGLGPVEVDTPLVAAARFIADYRPGVLAQGSELAMARDAGAVDDSHVVGEIGEVFAGTLAGRETAEQITLYKSLGHVVQDLAAAMYVHARASGTKA